MHPHQFGTSEQAKRNLRLLILLVLLHLLLVLEAFSRRGSSLLILLVRLRLRQLAAELQPTF